MNGTAEHTGLPDTSIDIITAGQAFHWFDQQRTRGEFARILRPDGWVVLLWNDRRRSGSVFLEAYEQLLRTYGTDYAEVNHTGLHRRIARDSLPPPTSRFSPLDHCVSIPSPTTRSSTLMVYAGGTCRFRSFLMLPTRIIKAPSTTSLAFPAGSMPCQPQCLPCRYDSSCRYHTLLCLVAV